MEKDTRARADKSGSRIGCSHCRVKTEGTPIETEKHADLGHLEEDARLDERAPLT